MKHKNILTLSILAAALALPSVYAESAKQFTPEQKTEIEDIIHNYLAKDHSEVLVEASQNLQHSQQEKMQQKAQSAIDEHGADLIKGSLTIAGNPKGTVTMVEFFDYQCSYCSKMKPVVNELIRKNPNLRVVFKEFPIFGKVSEMAARVAVVAAMHGKYMAFQNDLFKNEQHLNEKIIFEVAEKIGLNASSLKTEMESKQVTELLDDSRKLAEKIHLMGTPAFIILPTPKGKFVPGAKTAFVPGLAPESKLQDLIQQISKP